VFRNIGEKPVFHRGDFHQHFRQCCRIPPQLFKSPAMTKISWKFTFSTNPHHLELNSGPVPYF
jgi:hypothetical protein